MWWWYRTLVITIVRYYDAIKCLWLQLLTLCFGTSQYDGEWCDPLLVIKSMKDSEAYRIIDDPCFLLWYLFTKICSYNECLSAVHLRRLYALLHFACVTTRLRFALGWRVWTRHHLNNSVTYRVPEPAHRSVGHKYKRRTCASWIIS